MRPGVPGCIGCGRDSWARGSEWILPFTCCERTEEAFDTTTARAGLGNRWAKATAVCCCGCMRPRVLREECQRLSGPKGSGPVQGIATRTAWYGNAVLGEEGLSRSGADSSLKGSALPRVWGPRVRGDREARWVGPRVSGSGHQSTFPPPTTKKGKAGTVPKTRKSRLTVAVR